MYSFGKTLKATFRYRCARVRYPPCTLLKPSAVRGLEMHKNPRNSGDDISNTSNRVEAVTYTHRVYRNKWQPLREYTADTKAMRLGKFVVIRISQAFSNTLRRWYRLNKKVNAHKASNNTHRGFKTYINTESPRFAKYAKRILDIRYSCVSESIWNYKSTYAIFSQLSQLLSSQFRSPVGNIFPVEAA